MKELAIENLHQIKSLLARIARGDYGKTHKILSGASIGQHVRHILEFYIALLRGMEGGTVCYDERERDMLLETNIDFAMKTIDMIVGKINNFSDDIPVQFKAKYKGGGEHHVLTSSAFRELAYCVEHSIHQQAKTC